MRQTIRKILPIIKKQSFSHKKKKKKKKNDAVWIKSKISLRVPTLSSRRWQTMRPLVKTFERQRDY